MTLAELVASQSARLVQAGVSFGHGTTNADDEAAWLVLWALGLAPAEYERVAGKACSAADCEAAAAVISERITTRRPAAYLTREAWLHGVPFYIDDRAIVPRSLIAELMVDGGFDAWLSADPGRLLDLCTGNGSLAVIAALAWPDAQVDASDLSLDALAVARINVERHDLAARIRLIESDLFISLDTNRHGLYDLIVCNPPYVNAASMAALPAEYRAEPTIALDGNVNGGADGMDLVRRIVGEAPAYLAPNAALVIEVGHERAHFEAAFPRLEAVWLETAEGTDSVVLLTHEALLQSSVSR